MATNKTSNNDHNFQLTGTRRARQLQLELYDLTQLRKPLLIERALEHYLAHLQTKKEAQHEPQQTAV